MLARTKYLNIVLGFFLAACQLVSEPQPLPSRPPTEGLEGAELAPTYESIKALIIEKKCLSCHSPGGKAEDIPFVTWADLIESPLEIVIPGNSEESMFVIVLKEGARKPMPPPRSGKSPLTVQEVQVIEEWINNGAAP